MTGKGKAASGPPRDRGLGDLPSDSDRQATDSKFGSEAEDPRASRTTVPIGPEELARLLETSSQNEQPAAAHPRTRSSVDFGAFGGSISQAVTSVTADHQAVGASAPARSESPTDQLEQRVGDLTRVPVLLVSPQRITWHKLDHRAGFLLSQIDGILSYNDLLSVSGMPRLETLRTLDKLIQLKLVGSS